MNTTLLIMAAGIGSRYQTDKRKPAIKQLESIGLNGELIIDYSIHDALEAGFNKIIFIIRPDIEADFKTRIGDRVENVCKRLGVKVAYCFQRLEDIPIINGVPMEVPKGRSKPWGTGQAVLSAKNLLHEPFAVINADDFYGKTAFQKIHDWLTLEHEENIIVMAGFILKNTLSDHGGVTRGICKMTEDYSHVLDVVETSGIVKTNTGVEANGLALDPEGYVSMNFWGFPAANHSDPVYIKILEKGFVDFFKTAVPANPAKAEYLLPTHIGGLLRDGRVTVEVLKTPDKWFGVTYQKDRAIVAQKIRELIENKVYSGDLYSDL